MRAQLTKLLQGLAAAFSERIDAETAKLRQENAELRGAASALEARCKSAEDVLASLREQLSAIPSGPKGDAGPPGERGEKGEPGEAPRVEDVAKALLTDENISLLRGFSGEKGDVGPAGERGEKGEPGAPAAPQDVALALLADPEAVAALRGPAGERGEKGDRGDVGPAGERGEKGEAGRAVTAEELLPHVKAWFSEWALGFERNAQEVLERAASRIPKPADGRDGLGFDDMTLEQLDERTAVLRFRREADGLEKTYPLRLPTLVYRNVYVEANAYAQNDVVTRGGSLWIASRDVAPGEVPGRENDAWRLAVKKGADGPRGERGEKGADGLNGKDGRNYDGSRA